MAKEESYKGCGSGA